MLPELADTQGERSLSGRYDMRELIGSGGSATVHEVFDNVRGTTLAMKRLTPEAAARQTASLLFRREYRTLRELSHPAIVRVYDYGTDRGLPYYTMELAPGTDVRALAPMPWREACSVLRDVVSALSLLHSRRLVHRDVSAGNVRRGPDGSAKLLDFGALCPMGVAPEIVGTPAFVAPESLDGRPLDARTDLFSVGALAYFLLTGQHAHPASKFCELKRVWNGVVEPPSMLAAGVPEALDALVMSLLSLNPLARPVAAAEVFDRLSTIAGLGGAESGGVALGYLATPTLVGRDDVLARFRKRLLSADRGRGSALVIEGKPGFGRSRLLGSLVTEATVANVVAVCAQGAEGRRVFGVVRALAHRLLEAEPGLSRETLDDAAVVEALDIDDGRETAPPASALRWRTRVDGIASWFLAVSARVPLVLAIDDVDDADDASMSVIAKLSEAAPSRRLLVVATARAGGAADRFRTLGGTHTLRPLRAHETAALVASVFGHGSGTEKLSAWAHALSEGCPRVVLELLQHLVDAHVVRYENGGWVMPLSLAGLALPRDLEQAISSRLSGLGARARMLAEGLSLTVEVEPLRLDDYGALLGGVETEEMFSALNELVAAQILVGSGGAYVFVHDAMRAAVERAIPSDVRALLHQRLAAICAAQSPKASIIAAHHLLLGGDEVRAFATLARFTAERDEYAVPGYRFLRSREGGRLHERLLDWGFANGAPMADLLRLGGQLMGIVSFAYGDIERHAPLVMAELERETGLVHWDDFAHVDDAAERIRACVARAAATWASEPEATRGLNPREAIRLISSCTTHLTGVYSRTNDVDRIVALLPNIDRLAPVSPGVSIAADTARFAANARRGWLASDLRLSLLSRTRAPVPGLAEPTRIGLNLLTLYYQGLEEATLGDRLAFSRADEIELTAPYTALGWQVRTVAHLYQGQEKQAEACRRKRDIALVGQGESERHVEAALSYESSACIVLGDLTAVKRYLPALRERAAAHPGWMPQYLFVSGAHEALRGDLPAAVELMERAVESVPAGGHFAWAQAEGKLARLYVALGRDREARDRAHAALEVCHEHAVLPPYVDLLEASLALAEARLGDGARATERAAACVSRADARGMTGILHLDLLATQAEVALAAKDAKTFAAVSKRVVEHCTAVDSKAFAGRLSSLFRMSVGAGFEPLEVTAGPFRRRKAATLVRLRTQLELCVGAAERASRALGMVLEQSAARRGHLYINQPDGFTLAASRSPDAPPIGAEEWLSSWLRAFQSDPGDQDTTSQDGGSFYEERYRLVPLVTDDGGVTVVPGIVVIDCDETPLRIVPDYVLRELASVLIDAGDAPRT